MDCISIYRDYYINLITPIGVVATVSAYDSVCKNVSEGFSLVPFCRLNNNK